MAFGSKVNNGSRLVLGQQAVQQNTVTDIALYEKVALIALQALQIVQITGVGQFVKIDHGLVRACQPVQHKVRADKAGASGDENHGQYA